ncbi:MAG: murein L,D-transpeptidase catalytic domain family protein [Candidatus Cyclobacteriaceae bacterium M2_1C_046]
MKKLYGVLFIIFISATAFISTANNGKAGSSEFTEEKVEVILEKELSVAEKDALFKEHSEEEYSAIKGNKPRLELFTQALKIHHTLKADNKVKKENLISIIDYSLPSTEKRFWIIDLERKAVVENIVVSHGRNSGLNKVTSFSNKNNSFQSSMGAYLTAETYHGKHGLSLRLDGLEKGINDNARKRAIVIHTADYANPSVIKMQGRLGRSLGCPAIQKDKKDVIKKISGGSVLYVHGADESYKAKTSFKNIDSAYNAIEKELL